MNAFQKEQFIALLDILALDINQNAIDHGFWDGGCSDGEKIALMHSELSEALEGIRKPHNDQHCPSFQNKTIELADCIIRILDYCYQHNLHIGHAILAKHEFNKTREYKHGKAF